MSILNQTQLANNYFYNIEKKILKERSNRQFYTMENSWFKAGILLEIEKKYSTALFAYCVSLEYFHNPIECYIAIFRCRYNLGLLKESIYALSRGINLSSIKYLSKIFNAINDTNLLSQELSNKNIDDLISYFELDKNNSTTWLFLGIQFLKNKKYKECEESLMRLQDLSYCEIERIFSDYCLSKLYKEIKNFESAGFYQREFARALSNF